MDIWTIFLLFYTFAALVVYLLVRTSFHNYPIIQPNTTQHHYLSQEYPFTFIVQPPPTPTQATYSVDFPTSRCIYRGLVHFYDVTTTHIDLLQKTINVYLYTFAQPTPYFHQQYQEQHEVLILYHDDLPYTKVPLRYIRSAKRRLELYSTPGGQRILPVCFVCTHFDHT